MYVIEVPLMVAMSSNMDIYVCMVIEVTLLLRVTYLWKFR